MSCISHPDFGEHQRRAGTLSWMSERLEEIQERQAGHHNPTHASALPTARQLDFVSDVSHVLQPVGAPFKLRCP